MAGFYAIAGQKFFIGGKLPSTKTDFLAADFASQVWVEVDGWSEKGDLGDEYELIEETLINRGRVAKIKGTANAGSMENVFVRTPGDAGQAAMEVAKNSRDEYAFKVEGILDAGATTPEIDYFTGLVMSNQRQGGDGNTADKIAFTVEVTSNVVSVASA